MKKILFIIYTYSGGGGAESLLTLIVNHLDPLKYKVGIIECYNAKVKKEPYNSNVQYLGAIMSHNDSRQELWKMRYYFYCEPEQIIKRYIPQDYDLYVSFNYQLASFLLPKGKRNIAWIHSDIYDLQGESGKYKLDCQKKTFEKANKIVSISDITTKSLIDLCPESKKKIVEIYNSIDIQLIRTKSKKYTKIVLKHPNILFVGRLEERKDPMRLVQILKLLHEQGIKVYLYYLGEGILRGQIEKLVNKLDLNGYVHFLGYHDNPFSIIKQCDINCLLSHSEGFSMALLEGVALGKPFVATPVGGTRILANNGTCGKIITTDEEAVNAILSLLKMDEKELKEACYLFIQKFNFVTYIKSVENLFNEVLKEKVIECKEKKSFELEELPNLPYYLHFPVEIIRPSERIVLYGAGNVGKDYYIFLNKTKYCDIVAWVDSNYKNCDCNDLIIESPEYIKLIEYDKILIAIAREDIKNEIIENLLKLHVQKEKIVWSPIVFRCT